MAWTCIAFTFSLLKSRSPDQNECTNTSHRYIQFLTEKRFRLT